MFQVNKKKTVVTVDQTVFDAMLTAMNGSPDGIPAEKFIRNMHANTDPSNYESMKKFVKRANTIIAIDEYYQKRFAKNKAEVSDEMLH